jgi:hypothetical protein
MITAQMDIKRIAVVVSVDHKRCRVCLENLARAMIGQDHSLRPAPVQAIRQRQATINNEAPARPRITVWGTVWNGLGSERI